MFRPTIIVQYAQMLLATAKTHGLEAKDLLDAAAVSSVDGKAAGERMDLRDYDRLWRIVMNRVGDPSFPIAVARFEGVANTDALTLACRAGANLHEVIEHMGRFARVWGNGGRWSATVDGAVIRLNFDRAARVEMTSPGPELFRTSRIVFQGRQFTGVDWRPLEVAFEHPEPSDVSGYRAFFRAPLRFGCARSEIVLSRETPELPLLKSDPDFAAFFRQHVEQQAQHIESEDDLIAQVRGAICRSLGGCNLDEVARGLGVSSRSLRRKLQERATTFQELLDSYRKDRARELLFSQCLSAGEVGILLGYSDVTAFYRAFRRWFGKTPQEFVRGLPEKPAPRAPGNREVAKYDR